MVFSATQNTRGLPLLWRHTGLVADTYSYDGNGNVTGISDGQEGGLTSRSLGYDGLDQLTSASGIWGTGNHQYDALDNLRTLTLGSKAITTSLDAAPRHRRARDADDPLHAARAAEVVSLWRLGPR